MGERASWVRREGWCLLGGKGKFLKVLNGGAMGSGWHLAKMAGLSVSVPIELQVYVRCCIKCFIVISLIYF